MEKDRSTRSGVSIVIPVYNEEEVLPHLIGRLLPVMDGLGRPWEILFINDGSRDGTFVLLLAESERNEHIRLIDLNGNFGQHMAIMAGFSVAKEDRWLDRKSVV